VRQPLAGIRVLDFTTLLPGPLATLILAEAGAEVIKIERPPAGDDFRRLSPRLGGSSAAFQLLNRGKRSLALDLKDAAARARLRPLIADAEVLVEQFRPGAMERLGLGYAAVRAINRRIVYCSITGYGQTGPKSALAGHDLNYLAETGLLAMAGGAGEPPAPPVGQIADIGGGSLPAVINILLALRQAEATGEGCHLDVAMAEGMFAWGVWALARQAADGRGPEPGQELLHGGSPRYQVYRCADGRHLAVGALEQKFWDAFAALIGLDPPLRDDARDPQATRAAVAALIAAEPAAHWRSVFAGRDACATVVEGIDRALADPHFVGRGLFAGRLATGERTVAALPVPLAPEFRGIAGEKSAPALGEANDELLS
jgi:crotonobetainyl-CoA:carnitine CoA-transferase CaiB-like acyl-CoA transferase